MFFVFQFHESSTFSKDIRYRCGRSHAIVFLVRTHNTPNGIGLKSCNSEYNPSIGDPQKRKPGTMSMHPDMLKASTVNNIYLSSNQETIHTTATKHR